MSKTNQYEEIPRENVSYWKAEKIGDSIEGEIIDMPTGKYGQFLKLKNNKGETIGTPSHAILQSYNASLKVGDKIKIELVGLVKTANGNANDYKVYKSKA